MGIRETGKKVIDKIKKVLEINNSARFFDMTTPEARESTVLEDYTYASSARSEQQIKWVKNDNYYNSKHIASIELANLLEEQGVPFVPAIIPDPYIRVENQIIPDIPDFEFKGRDDDLDNKKAKQREYVVRSIVEANKLETMNTDNERRLNKFGNAWWKVAWDGTKMTATTLGDIVIGNPDNANMFPDPSAIDVQQCEFLIYAYRMHRRAAARMFEKQLKKQDISMNEIGTDGKAADTQIFDNQTRDLFDDTTQILEYWFKQDTYGSSSVDVEIEVDGKKVKKSMPYEWVPGDIACSIQINNTEIQYIPKYWIKTGNQNKNFPFVKYCKIPVENSFWDKSDMESIIPLVDQCDRELATAILNDTFMANDILVVEEGAAADGCEFETHPGAMWKMKTGQINGARRLGGLANPTNRLEMINFLRSVIQETCGDFDSSQGKEPVRVTTASGIAQLNERADARKNIKKADRTTGFSLLYELIDWTALEFYDDNRLIFIGVNAEELKPEEKAEPGMTNLDKTKGPIIFKFNSDNMMVPGQDGESYYPRIDTVVNVGDGLSKSKSFTIATTQDIAKMNITPTNYKIVISMVDMMDLPNKKDIKTYLEEYFKSMAEMAGQKKETPNVSISYKDLPQDAQIQILSQMGIQSQGGINPMSITEQEVPQNGQQTGQLDYAKIFEGLSLEEKQHLDANPQLLEKFIQSQGGNLNAMQQM